MKNKPKTGAGNYNLSSRQGRFSNNCLKLRRNTTYFVQTSRPTSSFGPSGSTADMNLQCAQTNKQSRSHLQTYEYEIVAEIPNIIVRGVAINADVISGKKKKNLHPDVILCKINAGNILCRLQVKSRLRMRSYFETTMHN